MIKELENTGRTWGEAKRIANNRIRWKAMVQALCLLRVKEVSVSQVYRKNAIKSIKSKQRFLEMKLNNWQGCFLNLSSKMGY